MKPELPEEPEQLFGNTSFFLCDCTNLLLCVPGQNELKPSDELIQKREGRASSPELWLRGAPGGRGWLAAAGTGRGQEPGTAAGPSGAEPEARAAGVS